MEGDPVFGRFFLTAASLLQPQVFRLDQVAVGNEKTGCFSSGVLMETGELPIWMVFTSPTASDQQVWISATEVLVEVFC